MVLGLKLHGQIVGLFAFSLMRYYFTVIGEKAPDVAETAVILLNKVQQKRTGRRKILFFFLEILMLIMCWLTILTCPESYSDHSSGVGHQNIPIIGTFF